MQEGYIKVGDSTRKLSHISEPSPEMVMKRECLKLEAQEMAKNEPLLSLPSNAQLVSNF